MSTRNPSLLARPCALAIALGLSLQACGDGEERLFTEGAGPVEVKPAVSLDALAPLNAVSETAARVSYALTIETVSTVACEGQVDAELSEDFKLSLAAAEVRCGSLILDLAAALGPAGLGESDRENGAAKATSDGRVLLLSEVAGARFDPPRPVLVGPIIQKPDAFRGYEQRFESRVEASVDGRTVRADGAFDVKVLRIHGRLAEFDEVVHWQITKTGFAGIPAAKGLLFERFEVMMNANPLMLPRLVIAGRLGEFLADAEGGELADSLLGQLTITLDAVAYEF